MKKELVSIILPTYNGSKFLSQSVESCLNQSYSNIELIIVNDASTDNTKEIILSFKDPRIIYLENDKNKGLSNSLNRGFSKSKGSYLTWTSDDNYYSLDAIGIMVKVLERNGRVDFIYSNYYCIYEKENKIEVFRVRSSRFLKMGNFLGPCFLYTRKVYEKIGEYNPEAYLVEDYEYWLRVRNHFKMKKIENVLYYYRYHTNSLTSSQHTRKIESEAEKIRDQYIPAAFRYYLHGRKRFFNNDLITAKKLLLNSVTLNPFNYQSWRFIALIFLKPSIVDKIRNIKHLLLKPPQEEP